MHEPPNAKLVGGVWLPAGETHFAEMMLNNPKRMRVIDGKHTYQYHKIEAALRHQPPSRRGICLDIGAHVGLWAMWLTRAFEQVHSFEPVPAFADIYPFNVDMAASTLHRFALGREEGTVSISVPEDMTGNSHIAIPGKAPDRRDGTGPVDTWHGVPMRSLDSFGFEGVDFIKIDVEGYELPVIEGGRETIQRCKPNMVVEQKGNEVSYGEPRDAAVKLLQSWGMKPLQVISGDWIMGW